MARKERVFSSRSGVIVFAAFATCASLGRAAGFECPDAGPPYPKPANVLSTTVDKKGGKLELTCTNTTASGDFVWTYTPPGGNKIVIGRCVYVGGQNSSDSINDPVTGNLRFWTHIVVDPVPINPAGDKRAVLDIFDKNNLRSTQRQLTYRVAQNKWVETAARFDTSSATYLAFNPADNNGDTIPDESFNYITSNLYGPTPPPGLIAGSEGNITLAGEFVSGSNNITWNVGNMRPTYVAGDYIDLENVLPSNVLSTDPRVTISTISNGVRLLLNTTWVPTTGEMLAVLAATLPNTNYNVDYAIVDGNPTPFYSTVFSDPRPLEELGFSSALNFSDMPGYGAGMGDLNIVPEPAALSLTAAVALLPRRRL